MNEKLTQIKDFIAKYWFLGSSLAIGILVYLLDSKGKKVKQLSDEIALSKMTKKIDSLKEKASTSEEAFQNSLRSYDDLKRLHPELYDRATKE